MAELSHAGVTPPGVAGNMPGPRPSACTRAPSPRASEALPAVGVGTWLNFDVGPGSEHYAPLAGVLDALFAAGGTVIDSSPMYRRAEQTTGELLAARTPRPAAFLATKVWTSGREAGLAQMETSFRLLRAERIDLLQIHNLLDWRTHLPTLRRWKARGRLRYIGITHYTASAYAAVEAALKAEPFDCLQINYAVDDRERSSALLPLARTAASRCSSTGRSAAAPSCGGCASGRCRAGPARSARRAGRSWPEVRSRPSGRDLRDSRAPAIRNTWPRTPRPPTARRCRRSSARS